MVCCARNPLTDCYGQWHTIYIGGIPDFCETKHVKSAPYHPASNGLAKRFMQSLKQSLKTYLADGHT